MEITSFSNLFVLPLSSVIKTRVKKILVSVRSSYQIFNVPLLYPLKTSENRRFFRYFQSIEVEHWLKTGYIFSKSPNGHLCLLEIAVLYQPFFLFLAPFEVINHIWILSL